MIFKCLQNMAERFLRSQSVFFGKYQYGCTSQKKHSRITVHDVMGGQVRCLFQ